MTPSSEAILHTLRNKKSEIFSRYPIHSMAIFGSRVRGDFTAESDVDILVDVDPQIGLRFVELADEIEQLLGMKVDLVSHRAIKADHMEAIKADLMKV
jgi:predicted nucleotidyltransferase